MQVSVIIPAYNEEKYIETCLKSLTHQTLDREEYEIIVCDDSSNDNTIKIASKYADQILRLKKCATIGNVRNKGARKAKGRLLLFVDADTILSNNLLEKILECKTVFGIPEYIFLGDQPIINFLNIVNNTALKLLPRIAITPGCCMFINREHFFRIGMFDESMKRNEDNKLFKKLFEEGRKISLINSTVYTSDRKLKHQGLLLFLADNMISYFKYLLGIKDEYYEPVR